ncbi:MAG: endopeptidase La [Deltaproteobacteria bacterium]|nr:endopeptidase La [Deltaproteobacteria bacterium]
MSTLAGGAEAPRMLVPVLPLRTGVLFPGTAITLPVGRSRSVALLGAVSVGAVLGVAVQRDPSVSEPTLGDLHAVGTLAKVTRLERARDRSYRVTLEGVGRFRLWSLTQTDPYWVAEVETLTETRGEDPEAVARAGSVRRRFEALVTESGGAPPELAAETEPGRVADQVTAGLGLGVERELEVLAETDVVRRLQRVAELVEEARTLSELRRKVDGDVRREVGKAQREALLREQMKAMRKELGDGDDDLQRLRDRLDAAKLPEEARGVADRELKRLEALGGQAGMEAHVIRTYLDWLAELPWSTRAEAREDLDAIQRKLDEDHTGLDEAKRRMLEHMAVLKLSGNPRGTLLCLVGPPGVGKTSLGQSIADATGRPFVRVSLGGVRDEAELRGHRRTYVGALPGRILHALRKVKVKNPVVLLDEVDKLGTGWGGSPEAALLEVLDPEQNRAFTDHYLELPFDLSEVLFVCTANSLETLSAPLRDRLEVLEVQGYTPDEKVKIARRHLLPRQLKEHAIPEGALTVSDEALARIVREYTREAGVRQLTRELTKLCRAAALEVVRNSDGKPPALRVEPDGLGRYLGRPKHQEEVPERVQQPGVATGLAWTPVGGEVLFVETSRMPGKGSLEITGQLGDVMKESARAALTYVRSNARELGVDPERFASQDLHIHVPAGAVPKDGPSAGVTIFTALASLLTGQRVRSDTAMTGEATLRGRVLPVGGIKAKVLAAHRAGLTRVILPSRNARDLDEVPQEVRDRMEFILAEDMTQVLGAALERPSLALVGEAAQVAA